MDQFLSLLKMIKRRRRPATDPQKLKKLSLRSFSRFLFVEAQAIGVEAEAIDEIAPSTSLVVMPLLISWLWFLYQTTPSSGVSKNSQMMFCNKLLLL